MFPEAREPPPIASFTKPAAALSQDKMGLQQKKQKILDMLQLREKELEREAEREAERELERQALERERQQEAELEAESEGQMTPVA